MSAINKAGFSYFLILCAVLINSGCATESVPKERLEKVAVVTSGSTNAWTFLSTTPSVSVVEVDGAQTDKPYGPIELQPGTHKIKMKCGNNINDRELSVVAGDVYEFAVGMGGGAPGCQGVLIKVKSTSK
jgi:hypothetical protein